MIVRFPSSRPWISIFIQNGGMSCVPCSNRFRRFCSRFRWPLVCSRLPRRIRPPLQRLTVQRSCILAGAFGIARESVLIRRTIARRSPGLVTHRRATVGDLKDKRLTSLGFGRRVPPRLIRSAPGSGCDSSPAALTGPTSSEASLPHENCTAATCFGSSVMRSRGSRLSIHPRVIGKGSS
jgi:hypothetical protein